MAIREWDALTPREIAARFLQQNTSRGSNQCPGIKNDDLGLTMDNDINTLSNIMTTMSSSGLAQQKKKEREQIPGVIVREVEAFPQT